MQTDKSEKKKFPNDYELVPPDFFLSQNYPNPFNDKTKIKYCVAYKTNVLIEILNEKGEIIETLINKKHEVGTFEIEFSAGTLPEGSYTCLMSTGDFISAKKMELLKEL